MPRAPRVHRSLYLAGMLATFVAGAAFAAAPKDHPLIQPYPGSVMSRREDEGFSEYKVVVGLNQQGKTDDEIIKSIQASGTLTRLFYENPRDRSPLEIFINYKEALEKAGFKILFECKDTACSPSWASSRWGRVTGMKYVSSPMWYLAARRQSEGSEYWIALTIMKLRHQIDVLEGKAMERGLVTVTAEALKSGLAAEGKAILDGVVFDHDKATIKAESKPALDVIGKYLKDNPSLKVFIVGHTDTVGSLDYNLKLSLQRAQAVAAALVKDHGIAADRLSAHGVGPLSPLKTNRTDQGKGQNRRVEMVAQ
ncbi:MAG TPA: OmpA family protein [Thermoanaerobaculia bacterium]|nr:OmpA family protein [Thermoanaerobaculia bacterium]